MSEDRERAEEPLGIVSFYGPEGDRHFHRCPNIPEKCPDRALLDHENAIATCRAEYSKRAGYWACGGKEYVAIPKVKLDARDEELVAAAREVLEFKPEFKPPGFNSENDYYEKGDEDMPFTSERFLYPLLGKEDARSFLRRLYALAALVEGKNEKG